MWGGAFFAKGGWGKEGERFFFPFFFFDLSLATGRKPGLFPFLSSFLRSSSERTGHSEQCHHPHEEQRERDDGEALGIHCLFWGGFGEEL